MNDTTPEIALAMYQDEIVPKLESQIEALQQRCEELERDILSRETRRQEILDFLQEEIGTATECEHCHHHSYHHFNYECEDCGADFPLLSVLAFKLHASHSEALTSTPENENA